MNLRWRRASQAGFTLIEMMVALALVALMSVSIFESLRLAQRSYKQVVQEGSASWEVFSNQRLIRTMIESAYPQGSGGGDAIYGLQGDKERLAVTAPAPSAAGHGQLRYEIFLASASQGKRDLVIRWNSASAMDVTAEARATQEVLAEDVVAIEWSYRAQSVSGDLWNAEWHDSWNHTHALPSLLRLRVKFGSRDTRSWPDLVIAPKLTDNARCVFDMVSRRCRNSA